MELESDFNKFLGEIRPTPNQKDEMKSGHRTLRDRLAAEDGLKKIVVSDFLQGSYKRATAVRPKGDARSDVDIIVVTNLSEKNYTPETAMNVFVPFLNKYYKGKWNKQGRSFGIDLSYVELDLVITSAPSEVDENSLKSASVRTFDSIEEARDWRLNSKWIDLPSRTLNANASQVLKEASAEQEWRLQPLRIPDRNAGVWESTHPLEQIRWARDKNNKTNGLFINVVKGIKWWRLVNAESIPHPKGFPLERLIGECCPDTLGSVAEGITRTMETIATRYAVDVILERKPTLPDYGVPSHDVFARVSVNDFKSFHAKIVEGAKAARKALDSIDRNESGRLWRELLGDKFPAPPNGGDGGKGYRPPSDPAEPGRGRFA